MPDIARNRHVLKRQLFSLAWPQNTLKSVYWRLLRALINAACLRRRTFREKLEEVSVSGYSSETNYDPSVNEKDTT